MSFGWAGKILRIDLSDRKSWTEPVEPYTRSFVGGRGISAKILYDELDPKLSRFDPESRLSFGPGVLTGTPAAGSSRLKISGLGAGGFMRVSGLGGHVPKEIKWAGYDLIVVQGKSDKPVYAFIYDDVVELRDASHVWGKDTYDTQLLLKEELGQSVEVMCIGPAAENGVSFSSIHTGWGSAAGLCGLGGVMGSKNLKAIAVRGTRGVKIANPEEFLKLAEEQRQTYADNAEAISGIRMGAGWDQATDWQRFGMGSTGNFEDRPGWDWKSMRVPSMVDFANKYGIAQCVCGNCPISHNMVYEVPGIGKGGAKCTGLSAVTLTLWNNDWELAFQAYDLSNRYGLDVIATTNIIAFLMELYDKGIIGDKDTDGIPMIRGDANTIISTIHKIGKQEGFGRLFKNGVAEAAAKIGKGADYYAAVVKGLELEPYAYRVMKQFALAQATNTKGMIDAVNVYADLWIMTDDRATKDIAEKNAEARYGSREMAIPSSYKGAAVPTVDQEGRVAAGDMVGICKWLTPWFMTQDMDVPARLVSLATGVDLSEADLLTAAQRALTLERAANVIRGMRRKDDTLPRRFFEEPEPVGPLKGETLSKEKFDEMIDDYYALRGYDKDGIPTEDTFKKYGLSSEWEAFKKKVPEAAKGVSKGAEA